MNANLNLKSDFRIELVNDQAFYLAPHKLYATEFYELCGGLNAIDLLLSK